MTIGNEWTETLRWEPGTFYHISNLDSNICNEYEYHTVGFSSLSSSEGRAWDKTLGSSSLFGRWSQEGEVRSKGVRQGKRKTEYK